MAIPVYPSDLLPAAILNQYYLQQQRNVVRTDMEQGAPRQRRRFEDTFTSAKVKWILTGEQMKLFEGWYKHMAEEGGVWVQMPIKVPKGILPHRVRFATAIKQKLLSEDLWEVSSTLDLESEDILSKAEVSAIISAGVVAPPVTPPDPAIPALTTESGDRLTTESGDRLTTEL